MLKASFTIIIFLLLINNLALAQNWLEQKAIASDRDTNSAFGQSVGISENYALIGAHREDKDVLGGSKLDDAGAAYFFYRDTTGKWLEKQKVVAFDREEFDEFGHTVAINNKYAAISAIRHSLDSLGNSVLSAGAVYIYKKNSNNEWINTQKIYASDRTNNANFGFSLSLSDKYLFVGAPFEDYNQNSQAPLNSAGAVYVFEKDSFGTFKEIQKIVSQDREAGDVFGYSIGYQAPYLVIGARDEDENTTNTDSLSRAGSVYIFEKDSFNLWQQIQKLVPIDRESEDLFGSSVSINNSFIFVGAPDEDENINNLDSISNAGAVYIFKKNGNNIWTQVQKINSTHRSKEDQFGLSLSANDSFLLIGTSREDLDSTGNQPNLNAGATYLYKQNNMNWQLNNRYIASDSSQGHLFGNSVAITNGSFLVGSRGDDTGLTTSNIVNSAGAAYFFDNPNLLSVKNHYSNPIIQLYPNPFSTFIKIELDKQYNIVYISLFNIAGQLLATEQIKNANNKVLNFDIKPGIYFLRVIVPGLPTITNKIIKTN